MDLHRSLEVRAALRPVARAAVGAGRATLVALDVSPASDLAAFRESRQRECLAAGIDLPRARFLPHVTSLRCPASVPPATARLHAAVAGPGLLNMEPETAGLPALRASLPTPSGPVYKTPAGYPPRAA